ncbi:putative major facilitator, sugar transporter [Rosa chinensis]|uniref:Putative major facilitator, sugar transporter n=1 Tax=Rosa chinensis TaxID=74649 RepID=A0A2P6QVL9_ROSCH|nr:putative major facilitator, sugar transporter [Rosa chinensis]
MVCTFVPVFLCSWGHLGWLIAGEIFTLETPSAGQSVTVFTNLLFTFVMAHSFIAMLCHLKLGIFIFFSGWVIIMSIFVLCQDWWY